MGYEKLINVSLSDDVTIQVPNKHKHLENQIISILPKMYEDSTHPNIEDIVEALKQHDPITDTKYEQSVMLYFLDDFCKRKNINMFNSKNGNELHFNHYFFKFIEDHKKLNTHKKDNKKTILGGYDRVLFRHYKNTHYALCNAICSLKTKRNITPEYEKFNIFKEYVRQSPGITLISKALILPNDEFQQNMSSKYKYNHRLDVAKFLSHSPTNLCFVLSKGRSYLKKIAKEVKTRIENYS